MSRNFANAFRWPLQDPEIEKALIHSFQSGQWGKYDGENCRQLLGSLQDYFDLRYFRLSSSGTVAIEIALQAAGVKKGDEVVVAGYDFPGNFRCIEALGGVPVLADINPGSWSMDGESFQSAISSKTKSVIVSHLHGGFADIDTICQIAGQHGITVIEDICQCPGAELNGKKLGTFGDICAISFGGSKLLSAGRGGAVGMNNESLHQRAKIYCERGNDAFPLSELQAAVLGPQLRVLDNLSEQRLQAYKRFEQKIAKVDAFSLLNLAARDHLLQYRPGFYKIPLLLKANINKQPLINELREKKIMINHGFQGFTNRSEKRCQKPTELTHAIHASKNTLLLHHPCLLSEQLDPIADALVESTKKWTEPSTSG
ncbi:MAG: aminotransferase class V-fold PLP-dependent enzyme [Planctomycetota bacterium]|nr:aminotransferase class V-fold PLP-dependent enzyme [Planctomycetota bacterium]